MGTTFKVYLPVAELRTEVLVVEPTEEKVRHGEEAVLLVEDEEAVHAVAQHTLTKYGYRVLSARSPDAAELLFAQHGDDIALLLTDVVMPQRSGKELYERLKAVKPGLKVLYMSGYTDHAILSQDTLGPIKPLLEKPFALDDLAQKVREVLDEGGTG